MHRRKVFVTAEQMPGLARTIEAERNDYARHALSLLLLAGVRKNELLRLRWADVDWDQRTLVRTHDRRRTVGSWLVQGGASLHLVAEGPNHKDAKTTAGYAYFHTEVRQAVHDRRRERSRASAARPRCGRNINGRVAGGRISNGSRRGCALADARRRHPDRSRPSNGRSTDTASVSR
jgi:integrase